MPVESRTPQQLNPGESATIATMPSEFASLFPVWELRVEIVPPLAKNQRIYFSENALIAEVSEHFKAGAKESYVTVVHPRTALSSAQIRVSYAVPAERLRAKGQLVGVVIGALVLVLVLLLRCRRRRTEREIGRFFESNARDPRGFDDHNRKVARSIAMRAGLGEPRTSDMKNFPDTLSDIHGAVDTIPF